MNKALYYIALLLPLCGLAQPTEEQIREVELAKKEVKNLKGEPFPDFDLVAMDGTHYTKDELEGKVVLVNFWFTSCRPCITEIPEMNEMVEQFENEDVIFLAPTFESEDKVNSFTRRREFNYEIVPDVKDFCLELNVRSYPTHFVVNREGIIEKVVIGYSMMTVGALKRSVRKLLKSK